MCHAMVQLMSEQLSIATKKRQASARGNKIESILDGLRTIMVQISACNQS